MEQRTLTTEKGFYIGDLCYCLSDKDYSKWGLTGYKDWAYKDFIVGGTRNGDGNYPVKENGVFIFNISVDAGNISVARLEACNGSFMHLGFIVEGEGTAEYKNNKGDITITLNMKGKNEIVFTIRT